MKTGLKRPSVGEEIASILREEIEAGLLSTGSHLNEVPLAERFAVSRNTLREAIRLLANQGYVEARPHRGAFVMSADPEQIRQIYRMRKAVEASALPLLDDRDLEHLTALVERLKMASESASWHALADLDIEFHTGIVAAIRSEDLDAFFRAQLQTLRLAFMDVDQRAEAPPAHVAEHGAIIADLRRGAIDEARDKLQRHLGSAESQLIDAITEAEQ